jgi:hypothetical protein
MPAQAKLFITITGISLNPPSIEYVFRTDHYTCIAYIDLINTIPSTMPSNRTSNDIDLVQPTQYDVQPNQAAKNPPPEPRSLPDFTPFQVRQF